MVVPVAGRGGSPVHPSAGTPFTPAHITLSADAEKSSSIEAGTVAEAQTHVGKQHFMMMLSLSSAIPFPIVTEVVVVVRAGEVGVSCRW